MSKLINFYTGTPIQQCSGLRTIDEVIALSNEAWDASHDFIQWIFPLREPSDFNPDAPLLNDRDIVLFRDNPYLRDKFEDAIIRGFNYYGLEVESKSPLVLNWLETENPKRWLSGFNHNWLRMTRFLKSMRLLGKEEWAVALFKKLDQEPIKRISENSWNYWHDATYGEI